MSEGVPEGDRVVVLRGPLNGNEAIIVSVNWHKSVVFVELDFVDDESGQRWDLELSAVKMERHNLESTDEPRGTFNELGGGLPLLCSL